MSKSRPTEQPWRIGSRTQPTQDRVPLGTYAAGARPHPIPDGAAVRYRYADVGHLRSRSEAHPARAGARLSAYGIPLIGFTGPHDHVHPTCRTKIRELQKDAATSSDETGEANGARRLASWRARKSAGSQAQPRSETPPWSERGGSYLKTIYLAADLPTSLVGSRAHLLSGCGGTG